MKNNMKKERPPEQIRLNKFVANSGVCSRREADLLITSGTISVNDVIVTKLGSKIDINDVVKYGKQTLQTERKIYLIMNKPKGFITSFKDPEKRKTVFHLLEKRIKERVHSIGRLDKETTGVLLFTNDGDLTKKLSHPRYECKKVYQITTDKPVKYEHIKELREGIELEDGFVKADEVQYVKKEGAKRLVGLEIHSGKNRIVRRMFEHFGYKVVKLDRVMFAELTKKKLTRGQWRYLTKKEIDFLKMRVANKS